MMLEALRIHTTWLKDPDKGVNNKLQELGRLPEDPRVMTIQFIGDLTQDKCVADWETPPKLPALYIVPAAPVQAEGLAQTLQYIDADALPIAIYYVDHDTQPERALTRMFYVLRAVARSLADLQLPSFETDRTLNNVTLKRLLNVAYGESFEPIGEAGALGALTALWSARDILS